LVELDKNEFRKMCPKLWQELEGNTSVLRLKDIGGIDADKFRGYMPTVIDYLRRCDTGEEAERTISYLLAEGEITSQCAEDLRKQLRERGLRSFGSKKDDGFYLREAGLT
jgi:hypothetical protein